MFQNVIVRSGYTAISALWDFCGLKPLDDFGDISTYISCRDRNMRYIKELQERNMGLSKSLHKASTMHKNKKKKTRQKTEDEEESSPSEEKEHIY